MGRKISKTKHDWESFILLYEWEQFLIYNIAVIFRILIFCQFGILLTVKDWHLWFCPLLNIRAVTDYEKVIITIDFFSVESYEEKAEFLRVTCTFSWASDCTLINFVLVFGELIGAVHFFPFWLDIPFLGKFGQKSQNCQFRQKFGAKTDVNMQNSMVMFPFF